jgi:hypothetical protein
LNQLALCRGSIAAASTRDVTAGITQARPANNVPFDTARAARLGEQNISILPGPKNGI